MKLFASKLGWKARRLEAGCFEDRSFVARSFDAIRNSGKWCIIRKVYTVQEAFTLDVSTLEVLRWEDVLERSPNVVLFITNIGGSESEMYFSIVYYVIL